jgi:uncharacterized membrane protein
MKRLSRWRLLVVISILVGAFAVFPYLGLDPAKSRIKLDPALALQFPLLLVHIFTAFLALLIGPLQFWESFRLKYARFHRLIGIVYLGCLGVSATTGVVITAYEESFTKQLAFLTLTMLWLVTGWKGFAAIRRRDVRAHRIWMMRNYAVTLVAITARVIVPLCMLLYLALRGFSVSEGVPRIVEDVLQVNIWLGIVLNLMVAEWVIGRKKAGGKVLK